MKYNRTGIGGTDAWAPRVQHVWLCVRWFCWRPWPAASSGATQVRLPRPSWSPPTSSRRLLPTRVQVLATVPKREPLIRRRNLHTLPSRRPHRSRPIPQFLRALQSRHPRRIRRPQLVRRLRPIQQPRLNPRPRPTRQLRLSPQPRLNPRPTRQLRLSPQSRLNPRPTRQLRPSRQPQPRPSRQLRRSLQPLRALLFNPLAMEQPYATQLEAKTPIW